MCRCHRQQQHNKTKQLQSAVHKLISCQFDCWQPCILHRCKCLRTAGWESVNQAADTQPPKAIHIVEQTLPLPSPPCRLHPTLVPPGCSLVSAAL